MEKIYNDPNDSTKYHFCCAYIMCPCKNSDCEKIRKFFSCTKENVIKSSKFPRYIPTFTVEMGKLFCEYRKNYFSWCIYGMHFKDLKIQYKNQELFITYNNVFCNENIRLGSNNEATVITRDNSKHNRSNVKSSKKCIMLMSDENDNIEYNSSNDNSINVNDINDKKEHLDRQSKKAIKKRKLSSDDIGIEQSKKICKQNNKKNIEIVEDEQLEKAKEEIKKWKNKYEQETEKNRKEIENLKNFVSQQLRQLKQEITE
ncbi:cob-I1, partial [Reticulomyxa filosa]